MPLILYFAVRIPAVRCDPYGDEAWYFYISKTIDWNWDPHLPFLPPIRWAFMLLMHPFTENIWTFRMAYIALNALVFLALYLVSKDWKLLLLGGLMYALDPVIIFFTGAVFTSTLAGTFALLSLAVDWLPLSLLLAFISVGCWEGMLFPFFVYALISFRKDKKKLVYLLPVALALATSFDNLLFHARLPGWTKGPITIRTLETLLFPIAPFLPFILSPSQLVLALSQAGGLIALNLIKGTLIEVWYQAPAHMLYYLYFAQAERLKLALGFGVLGTAITLYGFGHSLNVLYGKKDCCHLELVDYLKVSRRRAVLYDVFWAYSKYPYGQVKHKTCYTVGCLKYWARRLKLVISEKALKFRWLKLVYHEGQCFMYVWRPR